MNTNLIETKLTLKKLKLLVNLGWPRAERLKKQKIYVDIHIQFDNPPIGCVTDNLKDTFCYAELISTIKKSLETREFHLVEYLAHHLYQTVKQQLTTDTKVAICVQKYPAILKYLTKGITFSYGDC